MDFYAAHYQSPPPGITGREVYILDFSYPREVLLQMKAQAASLLVLDHHKTAEADLQGLDFCQFDMERSGAGMAWDYFFPSEPRHLLVNLVEDGDLWRFKYGDLTKHCRAILGSYDFKFDAWDKVAEMTAEDIGVEGTVIKRYQDKLVEAAARTASDVVLAGHTVPCTNLTTATLFSAVGSLLAEGRPFAVTYFVRKDGMIVYSLRSTEQGLDVSEIAKQFGGGGHARAAGFTSGSFQHQYLNSRK